MGAPPSGSWGSDAILAAGAGRTAEEHRAALAREPERLEAFRARLADHEWTRPVRYREADIAATVHGGLPAIGPWPVPAPRR